MRQRTTWRGGEYHGRQRDGGLGRLVNWIGGPQQKDVRHAERPAQDEEGEQDGDEQNPDRQRAAEVGGVVVAVHGEPCTTKNAPSSNLASGGVAIAR
jgi:hypothetical protein